MTEKIKNVFAVATEAAKKAGYKDFSEGSPGKEKRSDIAEAIKREMKKMELEKAHRPGYQVPLKPPKPPKRSGLKPPGYQVPVKKSPPSDMGAPTNKPYIDADEHFDAFAKYMKKEYNVDLEKNEG